MKKTLLLIPLLILGLSTQIYAQDKDMTKGIRAGWQISNIYEDGESAGDNLNSFYVGFFGERSLVPLLKFGSGLEYFQNGAQLSDDFQLKRHVISIPLYLKVKLGPVFATGGASANFKVAEKWIIDGEKVDLDDDEKGNVFDVPLHLGLGVEILMFTVEARYHWGMLDTFQNTSGPKAQYFQLGAGISF